MNETSQRWRAECMVRPDIDFLNSGTLAPTLRSALEATLQSYTAWMEGGPGGSLDIRAARGYLNMMEEQDRCRRVVANWLGVEASTVALLGNVTDGIHAALLSIDWRVGDRIVTTDEEHDALRLPLEQLKQRFGVVVDVVSFPKTVSEVADFPFKFAKAMLPSTKCIALSEVSHKTGIRLHIPSLIVAMESHPNIWRLIDAAHAAGTTDSMIQDGVDFYVFPGHKWLFGPVQTGVLRVSARVLRETTVMVAGAAMSTAEGIRYENQEGAWRYEFGTRDWSKLVGLREAIRFRQQWTEPELVQHYAELGEAFSNGYQSTTGKFLVGRAPLFSIPTEKSTEIANVLWEKYRTVVKPQEGNIRVSIPPWLEPEEAYEVGERLGQEQARME